MTNPPVTTPSTPTAPVSVIEQPPIAVVELTAPQRRNALDMATIKALEQALDALAPRTDIRVIVLRGAGRSFCAGFDLGRAVDGGEPMSGLIGGLSRLLRRLRQRDQAVVAAVQGHALAGGCALVGACDLAVVAPDAQLGYPVHRIGVSPAVSSPTTVPATGGHARDILLGGEIVDGAEAVRLGLATHLAASAESVHDDAIALAERLAAKGPTALKATKAWLNEIDGSGDAALFDAAAAASSGVCDSEESVRLLESFWNRRRAT